MEGSYTVEAALVMPLILFLFVSMLYMIFYLHDWYIIQVYANRMAQDCCIEYVENTHAEDVLSTDEIIELTKDKYDEELQTQLLMTEVTSSQGNCSRSLAGGLYTVTWTVTGEVRTAIRTAAFYEFLSFEYSASYSRVHIRNWINTKTITGSLGGESYDAFSSGAGELSYLYCI